MRSAAAGRVAERGGEERRTRRPFGQSPQLQQAEVGIGRLGEPLEDHRQQLLHQLRAAGQAERELTDRGARPLDVGEAEGGQAFLRGLGRQRAGARRACRAGARRTTARGSTAPWPGAPGGRLRTPRARSGPPGRDSRARARGACERARRPGWCGSAARRRAAGDARRYGETGTRRRVVPRRRLRRIPPTTSACSASSVFGLRTDSS